MTRLFVGNLSFEVLQGDLRDAFAAYGPVSSAEIVLDGSSGRYKGFGFVEMPWQAHALAAIQGLDGTDLQGRSINVRRAHPRSDGRSRGIRLVGTRRRRTDVKSDGRAKASEVRRWRLEAVPFGPKATAPFVPSVHIAGRRFLPRSAMPILSMRLSDARRGGSSATPMGHRACSLRVPLATIPDGDHPASRR